MNYSSGQRLPDVTEQPEYQRAFAGTQVEPDERRTKLGIPEDLGADLDAMAAEFIIQRRAFRPDGA